MMCNLPNNIISYRETSTVACSDWSQNQSFYLSFPSHKSFFNQKSNTVQQKLKYLNISSTNTMARETRNSNNKGVSKDDVAKAKTSVRSLLGKRTE
jgi:hypothetical protein